MLVIVDGKSIGTVRYVGPTRFDKRNEATHNVGIELDGPFGDHDGMVEGTRYFTCKLKYGKFVKYTQIEVRYALNKNVMLTE